MRYWHRFVSLATVRNERIFLLVAFGVLGFGCVCAAIYTVCAPRRPVTMNGFETLVAPRSGSDAGHDDQCESELIEWAMSPCQCEDRATVDPDGPPRAVVGLVRNRRGEVLIGLKQTVPGHPFSDSWHLPGGKTGRHEGDHNALVRELSEEAGLTHVVIEALLAEHVAADGMLIRLYSVVTDNADATAGDDLVDARFVTPTVAHELLPPHAYAWWPPRARTLAFEANASGVDVETPHV